MIKRLFDIGVSILVLALLSPVLFITALAVRLDSNGPALYRGNRTGQGGVEFKLLKFRTMTVEAAQQGPGITVAGDSRITRVGRILRRTKLDELLQLVNVLRGEMSVVGPRPEDPRYVALYTPGQQRILAYRPGITSMASVQYRNEESLLEGENWNETYITQIMPDKLAIDLDYMEHANLWGDIKIILHTIIAVFN